MGIQSGSHPSLEALFQREDQGTELLGREQGRGMATPRSSAYLCGGLSEGGSHVQEFEVCVWTEKP